MKRDTKMLIIGLILGIPLGLFINYVSEITLNPEPIVEIELRSEVVNRSFYENSTEEALFFRLNMKNKNIPVKNFYGIVFLGREGPPNVIYEPPVENPLLSSNDFIEDIPCEIQSPLDTSKLYTPIIFFECSMIGPARRLKMEWYGRTTDVDVSFTYWINDKRKVKCWSCDRVGCEEIPSCLLFY